LLTAKGGRRLHNCAACGATFRPALRCPHCAQVRLWEGKLGIYCQGCGRSA
jgi:hypothetical protein